MINLVYAITSEEKDSISDSSLRNNSIKLLDLNRINQVKINYLGHQSKIISLAANKAFPLLASADIVRHCYSISVTNIIIRMENILFGTSDPIIHNTRHMIQVLKTVLLPGRIVGRLFVLHILINMMIQYWQYSI